MGSAAEALVEESFVPEFFEDPPAGFDEVVVEGDVGMLHIDPKADAIGEGFPFFDIAENAFAATLVEVGDAVFLDFPLGGKAEFFFDFQFDGEAVGVPAALAEAAVAFHGAVAADDILEDAGEDVVDAGAAVGGGGAFVEHKQGGVGAFGFGTAEDVALFPVVEDAGVEFGEADAAGYGREHCG